MTAVRNMLPETDRQESHRLGPSLSHDLRNETAHED